MRCLGEKMEKRVSRRDEYTSEETIPGKGTVFYHLYCDRCGVRHPDRCVNHVYPEEGYAREMDLCHDCQRKVYRAELEDPTESIFYSRAYDLKEECLSFKSDFYRKFQLIEHLLEDELTSNEQMIHRDEPLFLTGTLAEIEKQVIVNRLKRCHGNRKLTAKELGIAKSTLHEKLRRWNESQDAPWPISRWSVPSYSGSTLDPQCYGDFGAKTLDL